MQTFISLWRDFFGNDAVSLVRLRRDLLDEYPVEDALHPYQLMTNALKKIDKNCDFSEKSLRFLLDQMPELEHNGDTYQLRKRHTTTGRHARLLL